MTWAVCFEDVTKRYHGGGPRYGTLRDELARFGNLGMFRRAGPKPRGILALDRVSFEVQDGEAFAVIGPNGAGKTTALKLLTRISRPTRGRLRLRGRIGALIDVGSGIHPELTGRENIWMYGSIIGMSRSEIAQRFDEIVDFSELGDFLDTPVKMYSSGMQVRLGFGIASHIDPDLFVVDEALAVGDAGFQAKCVQRMTTLVREGRTLLFVSHNLPTVETICRRGLFLLSGRVEAIGEIHDVLRHYLDWVDEGLRRRMSLASGLRGRGLVIERVTLHDSDGLERYDFDTNDVLEVRFHIVAEDEIVTSWFSLGISDGRPGLLILCSMLESSNGFLLTRGSHVIRCRLGPIPLGPGAYEMWMGVREAEGAGELVDWARVAALRIRLPGRTTGVAGVTAQWMYGAVRVQHDWTLE